MIPNPEEEWYASFDLGIEEIKMLHSHLDYAIKMWPGAPARPAEEQEFLQFMKVKLSAILMQYSYDCIDMD